MRNAGLEEAQAGIKIAGRNISITADIQMTLPLWKKAKKNQRASQWKRKESEKVGLKLNIQKTKIMASNPNGIQPVNPKGDQYWIFIGKTDAEDEAPILWLPDVKNWLIKKTLMLEKIEGRRRKGQQRKRWLDDITD